MEELQAEVLNNPDNWDLLNDPRMSGVHVDSEKTDTMIIEFETARDKELLLPEFQLQR